MKDLPPPRRRLPELIADYVHLRDVLADEATQPDVLRAIREFHRESMAGRYYQSFNVNSRNYTEKSRGTETFIAEHSRLVEACLRAERAGDLEAAAEGLELLIGLMREIDRCERDIDFFADEAGSWQAGVLWDRVLPAWFRSLSPEGHTSRGLGSWTCCAAPAITARYGHGAPLLRLALEVDVIVGVDFGAPQRARDQRKKIVAIAAQATGWHSYRIDVTGMNERLLASEPPGWTAKELADELVARPARVVGFDFPFCVPHALLRDPKFAGDVGFKDGAFIGWRSFNRWIALRLPLAADPIDFTPFAAWRERADRKRLWTKRATDIAARGQPPLKDKFQATFQMTLLGNAVLSKLWESEKYRVLPFPGGRGPGEVIEVYPGATLRAMGLARYKSRPDEAVRLGIAACAAAGIELDIAPQLVALACRYSSGTAKTPDYDVADAFVALCTTILHAENGCRPVLAPDPRWEERLVKEWEGAIWVPTITTSALSSVAASERRRLSSSR